MHSGFAKSNSQTSIFLSADARSLLDVGVHLHLLLKQQEFSSLEKT